MKEVYITKANAFKILRRLNLCEVDLEGDIYKEANRVLNAMFSKLEKHELLAYKKLMENPEGFMDEIYVKVRPREDTYGWVYEEDNPPAYHSNSKCPRLLSSFKNYRIPAAIRFKGVNRNKNLDTIKLSELNEAEKERVKSNVIEYRKWWKKEGEALYREDKDTFLMRVNNKFQPEPRIRKIEEFEIANSGIEIKENITLIDIENKIDQLIKDSGVYYKESEKNRTVLSRYARWTSYAYKDKAFPLNDTSYTDEEIREVLKEYDKRFKFPLKVCLKEYYRIKNNPDLGMDQKILDQLGFVPCGACPFDCSPNETEQSPKQYKLPKLLEGYLDSDNWSEEMWAIWWEAHDYNEDQEEREMMEYEEKVLGMRRI